MYFSSLFRFWNHTGHTRTPPVAGHGHGSGGCTRTHPTPTKLGFISSKSPHQYRYRRPGFFIPWTGRFPRRKQPVNWNRPIYWEPNLQVQFEGGTEPAYVPGRTGTTGNRPGSHQFCQPCRCHLLLCSIRCTRALLFLFLKILYTVY
jgi:hypothetical protein